MSNNPTIDEWVSVVAKLKIIQDTEKKLRTKLVDLFFDTTKEGVQSHKVNDEHILKATIKFNRSIDKASLKQVLSELPDGMENKLIDYKPSLQLRNYKNLIDAHKEIFNECLITKPSSPSLSLVEVKKE